MSATIAYRLSPSAARRLRNSVVVWVVLAVGSGIGVLAATVAYATNRSRLAAYERDAICMAPIMGPTQSDDSPCRVETAWVARHWTRSQRSSRSYYLALATIDGVVDSITLKGKFRRNVWSTVDNGTELLVQRFRDPSSRKVHVTIVQSGGALANTAWNPVVRDKDAMVGIAFLGTAMVGALIAAAYARLKQRRAAEWQPF